MTGRSIVESGGRMVRRLVNIGMETNPYQWKSREREDWQRSLRHNDKFCPRGNFFSLSTIWSSGRWVDFRPFLELPCRGFLVGYPTHILETSVFSRCILRGAFRAFTPFPTVNVREKNWFDHLTVRGKQIPPQESAIHSVHLNVRT